MQHTITLETKLTVQENRAFDDYIRNPSRQTALAWYAIRTVCDDFRISYTYCRETEWGIVCDFLGTLPRNLPA